MDDRRGGRGGRMGGPSFRRNTNDDPRGGGGRGYGRGRGRYGRGGGGSFSENNTSHTPFSRDRTALNPVHLERFEPSPTAARARSNTVASESPDQSGYESGEIMPGPARPVAVRRGSNASSDNRGNTTTATNNNNYHSSNGSLNSGRGGRSLDGRGPGRFEGRGGRGRGRSYMERGGGGRGRGRFGGRGGGGDSLSGRYEEPRRFIEPPREVEVRNNDPPPFARDDDRRRDRSPLAPRDVGGGGRGPMYSGDPPPRFFDGPDDRVAKRPRDDFGFKEDFDEKRPRDIDYGSSRSRSLEEGRSYPSLESRSRQAVDGFGRVDDRRSMDDRRLIDDRRENAGRYSDPRGPGDDMRGPPMREDTRGTSPRNDLRGPSITRGPPPRDDLRGPPLRDDLRGPVPRDDIRGPPSRDDIRGLPLREVARGPPHRDDFRGPPLRDDLRGPAPRDDIRRPPPRDDIRGPPLREDARGPPHRDDLRGPPFRDELRGPPPRDDIRGPPPRDDIRGPPLREDARGPLHRDDLRGPPLRDDIRAPSFHRDDMRGLPPHRDDMRRPPMTRDDIPGPLRDDMRGPPLRDDPRGPSLRDDFRGPPPRDDIRGPPPRESMRGPPPRDEMRGPPLRDDLRGPPSRDDMRGPILRDDGRGHPLRDDVRGPLLRDSARGPSPRDDVRGPPLSLRRDEGRGRASYREDSPGVFREAARDGSSGFRDHREPNAGGFRDDPRDRPGSFRDEDNRPTRYEASRESSYADLHLRDSRPSEDIPYRQGGPRDAAGDVPRDFHARDMHERRNLMGPEDDLRQGPSSTYDRPSRPLVDSDRDREFRGNGDGFRDGPGLQNDSRSGWSGPPSNRRDQMDPSFYRNDERLSDVPMSDATGKSPQYDGRGSFADFGGRGRGRGRGGRGFAGRGRGGRDDLDRFGSGRGTNDLQANRDGAKPSFRSLDDRAPRSEVGSRPDQLHTGHDAKTPTQNSRFQKAAPLPMEDESSKTGTKQVPVVIKDEPEPAKPPRPLSPPPASKPSGIVMALARLADLEAQMEYNYTKHMQLVKRQRELQLQATILEHLPVGLDAIREELAAANAAATGNDRLNQ